MEQGGLLGRARCHGRSTASSHAEPALKIAWHFYAGAAVDGPGSGNTWNIQIHPLRPGGEGRVKNHCLYRIICDVHFNNLAEEWLCAFTKMAFF